MSDTRPRRQPAYDAVYAVIRKYPASGLAGSMENARVWRAVEAALDAMEPVTADDLTANDNAWRAEVAQLRAQLAQLDRDGATVSLPRVVEQLDRLMPARQPTRPVTEETA